MERYKIITLDNLQVLVNRVNESIESGSWKPQGGICVVVIGSTVSYIQAMVRA